MNFKIEPLKTIELFLTDRTWNILTVFLNDTQIMSSLTDVECNVLRSGQSCMTTQCQGIFIWQHQLKLLCDIDIRQVPVVSSNMMSFHLRTVRIIAYQPLDRKYFHLR